MSDFLLKFPIDGDGKAYATVHFYGEFDRLEAIEFTLEMLERARQLAVKHATVVETTEQPVDDESEVTE